MSSSISFQPPVQGAIKPSKSTGTNSPFVPSHLGAKFEPFHIQTQSANLPKPMSSPGSAQGKAPLPTPQSGKTIGSPNTKPKGSPTDKADKKDTQAKINPIGFLFPTMTLIGTPLMLITSLMGVKIQDNLTPKFEPNGFYRFVSKHLKVNPSAEKMVSRYKLGRSILATGIIPKTLIGIMYGIQAQQPSILLAHLFQLPLTPMIIKEKRVATTFVYLMGGLFTLGFINDVENGHLKEGLKDASIQKPRLFNMTTIKQVFSMHSGLSLMDRVSKFCSESVKMLRFSAQDHVLATQRAFRESKKLINGEKNELTDLKTTGSISKSSLGFLLCYAATIPALVSTIALNSKGKWASAISKYSMATTLLSGLMLNFGMILVALNGKNWAERIPMAGTSMELSGTVVGYSTNNKIQPFAVALQQLGAGLNNIFYAHQAQRKETPPQN